MKSFLSLALFAGAALAQSVQIGLPLAGQRVTKGSEVTVQVQRPVRSQKSFASMTLRSTRQKNHTNINPELFDRLHRNGRCHRHYLMQF